MEQENNNSNQQNKDAVVEQMEKINFSLSEISGSLAFFKWLAVIVIAIVILLGVIALAFFAKTPTFTF